VDVGAGTATALAGAPGTFVSLLIGVVILRAFILALLTPFVFDAFLAHLLNSGRKGKIN
jgi:hypothetical protein